MSEIKTKKLSSLSEQEVKAILPLYGQGYKKVNTLPITIPDGELVSHNGYLYKGLQAGESSLPAGTPWPVAGFKEAVGYMISSASGVAITLSRSTILSQITAVRLNAGQYYFSCADFAGDGLVHLQFSHFGTHGSTGIYLATQSYSKSNNRLFLSTYAVLGSTTPTDAALAVSFFTLRVYPPLAPPPTPPNQI